VQEDSPIIQLIHGIGRFFDSEAPPEVSGKPLAFLGDRTRFGEPRPVIPPTESTWKWKNVTVSEDAAAWAVHQGEDDNKGKLWTQAGGLSSEVLMPRLVYLPSVVAKYAADSPKTAWELYQFIDELVVGDAPELTEEDVASIKQWLLTVGQTAGAKGLALNMGSVVTTSPVFQEWAFHHLNSYLGEKLEPAQAQQAPSTTTPQGHQQSNFLEDVVRILLKNAGGNQGESNSSSSDKAEEKIKAYTQYEVAKLMGYARENDAAQLPYIWKLFKTTKETDDHRTNLHREMLTWSQSNGIAIDRSVFFSKETMEDIVKMRFNPVGLSATLTTCEKGVTNLLCLPRTAGEVEALKLFERAVEETMATRTLKEAEKLASSNKRDPPTDYFSLKVMVGTYAALLCVLFGEKCHLYEMMMKLYKILDLEEVFTNRYAFDALKCKQITWAIFEDSRSFFWKKVSPLDLAE
jgi:hypothetical protein